ncbi:MAG: hypothetical protein HGB19_05750 [Chlorobiales bacterium]|nr:hypothetical protein [Chlorobiales bacterium]
MTDEKIKTILKTVSLKLTERTIGNAEQFTYDELQAADLPRQIKTFLLAELEFSARTYIKHLKSTRFNFQDDSLTHARNEFVRHLVKTVTLKREDYLKLLDTAVVIEFRYLCRPQKMLAEMVFGQRTEQSSVEVMDRLRNFTDYAYLITVFIQYLEKKNIASITREKFEKIISDIDQKIADSYDDHDFLMLIKPIYEFFDLGGETEVPVVVLAEFMREKNVKRLEKLIVDLTRKGVATLSLHDIDLILHGRNQQVLEEAKVEEVPVTQPEKTTLPPEPPQVVKPMPAPPEPKQESKPVQKIEPEPKLPEVPVQAPQVRASQPIPPPEPTISQLQVQAETNLSQSNGVAAGKKLNELDIVEQIKQSMAEFTPMPKPKKVEEESKNTMPEQQANLVENTLILDDTNVPDQVPQELEIESVMSLLDKIQIPPPPPQSRKLDVSEEFSKMILPEKPAEIPKPTSPDDLKDLRAMISESDRKRFIKRIFKGKEEGYEDALSKLNEARSWREASLFIDEEIFLQYKVDEYSPEAVFFTDIVFDRYKNQPK